MEKQKEGVADLIMKSKVNWLQEFKKF